MLEFFKTHFKSVYVQLMLLMLLAVSLLYVFNVQINILASNDVKKKTAETATSKLEYYVSNLEYDVTHVIAAQKMLLVNQDLLMLSSGKYETKGYEKKRLIDGLQTKLMEVRDGSRMVKDVFIYIPLLNKKLSSEKYETLTEEDQAKMQEVMDEEKYSYPFMQINDSIYINLTAINTALSTYSDIVPLFMISVEFSKEVLQQELVRLAGDEAGTAMMISPRFYISGKEDVESTAVEDAVAQLVRGDKTEDVVQYLEDIKIEGHRYAVIYKRPKMLNVTFVTYIPEEYFFNALNVYTVWLWVITVITLLIFCVISLNLYQRIKIPLNHLIEAFEKTHDGNFNVRVEYEKNDEFSHVYEGFNQMFQKIRQLVQSVYEQQIYVQSAQLKQLQCQINPHFLYNTMFIIYRMSKSGDCASIGKLSEYLGKYYQYITKGALDEVCFRDEVAHAKYYVEIQLIRFSERISCEFDPIPPGCEDILVPKLMLQPILENAFVHGLEQRAENGRLLVKQFLDGGDLVISVEDNGTHVEESRLLEIKHKLADERVAVYASGLINVHRRLKIRFGDEYGIAVSIGEMGGFQVVMRIPVGDEKKLPLSGGKEEEND